MTHHDEPVQAFQDKAKASAVEVLQNGPATVESLQLAYANLFGRSLREQRAAYAALVTPDGASANQDCADAVGAATSWSETCTTHLAAVERYVTWNIPRMEDGGNFGVTVQLAVVKHVQDLCEKVAKGAEELSKYNSSRADALDKCKQLATESSSQTSSTSVTESSGGKEEGTETKRSKEDKSTTTAASGPDGPDRLAAVVSTDCLFWCKAKLQMELILTGYVSALDYMEKNSAKLAEPRAGQGSGGHFSSMY
jgi:hypothetical protein